MAKSWPICQCPRRPSFRPLCAAETSIFATSFPSFFHGGREMGKIDPILSAISVPKGCTLKWRRVVRVATGSWRNHVQSVRCHVFFSPLAPNRGDIALLNNPLCGRGAILRLYVSPESRCEMGFRVSVTPLLSRDAIPKLNPLNSVS